MSGPVDSSLIVDTLSSEEQSVITPKDGVFTLGTLSNEEQSGNTGQNGVFRFGTLPDEQQLKNTTQNGLFTFGALSNEDQSRNTGHDGLFTLRILSKEEQSKNTRQDGLFRLVTLSDDQQLKNTTQDELFKLGTSSNAQQSGNTTQDELFRLDTLSNEELSMDATHDEAFRLDPLSQNTAVDGVFKQLRREIKNTVLSLHNTAYAQANTAITRGIDAYRPYCRSNWMRRLLNEDGVFRAVHYIDESAVQRVEKVYEEPIIHASTSSECILCCETLEAENTSRMPCCGMLLCTRCLETHLITKIQTSNIVITCPSFGCLGNIDHNEILRLLSSNDKMKQKYLQFLVDSKQDPHKKTCPRCYHITEVEPEELTNADKSGLPIVCVQCSLLWCFVCQAPMHSDMTCAEYKRGDRLLEEWLKERNEGEPNAQPCPQCKVLIQRTYGCNHIRCTHKGCNTDFCYICGQKYIGSWHQAGIGDCGCRSPLETIRNVYNAVITGLQTESAITVIRGILTTLIILSLLLVADASGLLATTIGDYRLREKFAEAGAWLVSLFMRCFSTAWWMSTSAYNLLAAAGLGVTLFSILQGHIRPVEAHGVISTACAVLGTVVWLYGFNTTVVFGVISEVIFMGFAFIMAIFQVYITVAARQRLGFVLSTMYAMLSSAIWTFVLLTRDQRLSQTVTLMDVTMVLVDTSINELAGIMIKVGERLLEWHCFLVGLGFVLRHPISRAIYREVSLDGLRHYAPLLGASFLSYAMLYLMGVMLLPASDTMNI